VILSLVASACPAALPPNAALALLKQSVAEGWQFESSLHAEKSFEKIRDFPAFKDFLKPKG